MLTVGQLEGTWTLSEVRRIVTEERSSGASDEAIAARLHEARLVSPQVPPSLLFDPTTP